MPAWMEPSTSFAATSRRFRAPCSSAVVVAAETLNPLGARVLCEPQPISHRKAPPFGYVENQKYRT